MTETCHLKFTEKFENQNYIIYIGVITATFAVLFIYRFHFVAVVLSYVLGCLVCHYGLNSNFLQKYIQKFRCQSSALESQEEHDSVLFRGCGTCGSKECTRHDMSIPVEPWVGLQIHKQLDQAIEDFYNTILDQFVNSWYSKITHQPFFVDELRYQLRYASSCLLKRALKVDYPRFLTERLIPCALMHYRTCIREPHVTPHPAAANRTAEMRYLTSISEVLMPLLLRPTETQNSVFRVLIREIFAKWVLLSLTDVLADPYILNALIILATGDETMAQLPPTPNYKVEFLERFGRRTESAYARRGALLAAELDALVADQDHFYALMQFLKAANHIHLLQFYKDIKLFQTKILNPELGQDEQAELHKEACEIYELYLSRDSISRVPLEAALCDELYDLLQAPDSIKRLQTSRALYQAARESHDVLKKVMLPKFLHSEEYYKLVIGSRTPTGYHKQMAKKNPDNLILSALKLGNKLKGALKPQTIDGQVLSDTNSEDSDSVDNMDILKYLDALAAEEDLRDQDLSTYKVVLTDVDTTLQAPPRRGTVRVFTIAAHRVAEDGGALWAVRRSEHDFHLVRAKLRELYGERLLHDLPLPSRRDNSPNETLRYKYEDFLQRLLQKSLVQTSKLLYLFLTVEGDFSAALQEASALTSNSNDIANIYQAVALKLRKEKGQHLESFLTNLLVTSDMERYQALKQGNQREGDEDVEVGEDATRPRPGRSGRIADRVFGDLFAEQPKVRVPEVGNPLTGFTQCLMFLLEKVVQAHGVVTAVVGVLLGVNRQIVDEAFNAFLGRTLNNVLCERRLAHLIRLGHGLLFGKRSIPRCDPGKQQEQALRQLLGCVPSVGTRVLGAGLPAALGEAFHLIQQPHLNKHLVYNLLDLCLSELFPELGATSKLADESRS